MAEFESPTEENSIPFYPEHVGNEAKVVLGVAVIAIIVGLVGLFSPVGLGEPADPMNTPCACKTRMVFPGSVPAAEIHFQVGWCSPAYPGSTGDYILAFHRPETRFIPAILPQSSDRRCCLYGGLDCHDHMGGGELV